MVRAKALLIVSALLARLSTPAAVACEEFVQSSATDVRKIAGVLATVEPAARRITIVPAGESKTVELAMAERAQILSAEEPMTLRDLVLHVGSRVVVDYRDTGSGRVAEIVTVEILIVEPTAR